MPSPSRASHGSTIAIALSAILTFAVAAILEWPLGWRIAAMIVAMLTVIGLLSFRAIASWANPRLDSLSPRFSAWLRRTVEREHTSAEKCVWLVSASGLGLLCLAIVLFGPRGWNALALAGLTLSIAGAFAYFASKMCPRKSKRGLAALAMAGWCVSLSANFVAAAVGGSDFGPGIGQIAFIDDQLAADIEKYEEAVEEGDSLPFFEAQGPIRYGAWLRDAENGIAIAQNFVSRCLYFGAGVTPDMAEARTWARKAAAQGVPESMLLLGYMHEMGEGGAPVDSEHALALYQEAAELGNQTAMNNIGVMYRHGSTKQGIDAREAMRWFRMAANRGSAIAMQNLADVFSRGMPGVPPDIEEAEEWYARAAEAGNPTARGILVSRPILEAMRTYVAPSTTSDDRKRAVERASAAYEAIGDLGVEPMVAVLWTLIDLARELPQGSDDPMRQLHESMVDHAIHLFGRAPRSTRRNVLHDFQIVTEPIVVTWYVRFEEQRVVTFWRDCYSDLDLGWSTRGELDALIRQLRICILALVNTGQRSEAASQLDEANALCDAVLRERPWDWYLKDASAAMNFSAANAFHDLGDREEAQQALSRAWTILLTRHGRLDLLTKYPELPLKGGIPPGASEEDADLFWQFALPPDAPESAVTQFTIPVDFGGTNYPFHVYIYGGSHGYAELLDQFRWVEEYRSGTIPTDMRARFQRLSRVALENNVDFRELCVAALLEPPKDP